jgi:AraC-like DNA-binding protein
MRVWELGPERLTVAGAFDNLAVHHHPAVQVAVGLAGPLSVSTDGGEHHTCRLVVVASGKRHAVRSDSRSGALTIYLGPHTGLGMALNALSRTHGVWIVGDGEKLADATAAVSAADGSHAAADFLLGELCGMPTADPDGRTRVHPQLQQAIEVVAISAPGRIDLVSVADAVALSADYLGRLCKQQTGVSFSATTRWARLLIALRYLADGVPVTNAAHLAGFTDGSHANRVCWEMAGTAPSELARALKNSPLASQEPGV